MDHIHILYGWHLLLDYFMTSNFHGDLPHGFIDNCRATDRLPQPDILIYCSQRFQFVLSGRNVRHDLLLIRSFTSIDFTVCYPDSSLDPMNSIKILGTVGASAIVINIISVGIRSKNTALCLVPCQGSPQITIAWAVHTFRALATMSVWSA